MTTPSDLGLKIVKKFYIEVAYCNYAIFILCEKKTAHSNYPPDQEKTKLMLDFKYSDLINEIMSTIEKQPSSRNSFRYSLIYQMGVDLMKIILIIFWILACEICFARTCPKVKDNEIVIDQSTCPGGCTLGTWSSKEIITVLDKPNGKKVTVIKSGENFQALAGETHVVPIKLIVLEPPPKGAIVEAGPQLKVGDTFYLLAYHEEAIFNACMNEGAFLIDCTQTVEIKNHCSLLAKKSWVKTTSNNISYSAKSWIKIKTNYGLIGWIEPYKYRDIKGRNPSDD